MITNTGKRILAKYLIGQAPAYASYIAIGCGATPVADLSFAVTKKQAGSGQAVLTIPNHTFRVGQSISIRNVDTRLNGQATVISVGSDPDTVTIVYSGTDIPETSLSPSGLAIYNFANKTALDFEMFRVPISSRGFVTENGISKIVFTAELPTEERYEISEVGMFSAGSNTSAGAYDSKTVFSFSQDENWEEHTSVKTSEIHSVYTPLNGPENNNNIYGSYDVTNDGIDNPEDLKVFHTNANNRVFNDTGRIERYERCRFLNNIIAIRGNHSDISVAGDSTLEVSNTANHIHMSGATIDFTKNSPTDELRLAFSVVNREAAASAVPQSVRIIVEFSSDDDSNVTNVQSAKFEVNLDNGLAAGQHDFTTNRYVVVKKQLQELIKTNPFTWGAVKVVKIYASVIHNDEPSEDFYVCLDALRLENLSTENALYGLTGYSIIKNTNAETIVKSQNTSNYLEFRFAMDVQ